MPQLPSGRHVAIGPDPFVELISDVTGFGNLLKITKITCLQDLHEWFDILFFVEKNESGSDYAFPALSANSLIPPPDLVLVNSGYRVSAWQKLSEDWSNEDRQAMIDFIDSDRFTENFSQHLKKIFDIQKTAHTNDSPFWDTYDMLAALRNVVHYIVGKPEQYQTQRNAFDRISGTWQMLTGNYEFLRRINTEDRSVRGIASAWRNEAHLEQLPEDKQRWIFSQMIVECINLWNFAFEILEPNCPDAYNIIVLVTLSGPALEFIGSSNKS